MFQAGKSDDSHYTLIFYAISIIKVKPLQIHPIEGESSDIIMNVTENSV